MKSPVEFEDIRALTPEQYDNLRTHYFGLADHIIELRDTLKELGFKQESEAINKMNEIFRQTNLGHVL